MRILGWMHRKLRQNNADPLKDFNIGRASLDECKPQFTRAGSIQKDHYALYLKPFPGLGLDDGINNNKEEEEESLSDIFTHLHHGLLAIGTLGADPVEPIPALEKETGHQAPHGLDATGHLEKVAEEEANEDAQSGGCHVDAKPVGPALAEPAAHQTNLQVDACGHQAEYSDKAPAAKKEHRVSLGELFSKTKTADDGEHADGKAGRADGAKAVHLVKKILKRKTGTGKNSGPNEAVGAENKIHKLFHMFNRKVHPSECCPTTVKKCSKEDIKHMKDSDILDDKDTFIHVDPVTGKGKIRQYKGQPNPPDFALCSSDSNGNREYWIKTDADYLVLEL
ncbi:protein LAZY 1 [Nymphaea colorata]|nr:protein LAZY 1 [Nymphaea colorata]